MAVQAFAVPLDQACKAWRNRKSLFGKRCRGGKKRVPRQSSVLPVNHLHQPDRTGNADRASANDRIEELHGLAVAVEKQISAGIRRRRFAPVYSRNPACFGVIPDEETAASDA